MFRTDIVRNEEMGRRVGVREELNVTVNQKVSKWIRHVEQSVRPSVCP